MVDQFAGMAPFAATIPTFEAAALPDSVLCAPGAPSLSPEDIPEDIGLPSDGIWDYYAAYEQRFCYDHGEFEYLLETANRWISSNDLGIPGAEVKLENLLQDKVGPSIFNPYARRCQAECHASLHAQIYSIMEKREDATSTLYLAKFRAFWTPGGSKIDDQGLLAASLESNQRWHCRRSPRLAETVGKREKIYEKVMMVVNLE